MFQYIFIISLQFQFRLDYSHISIDTGPGHGYDKPFHKQHTDNQATTAVAREHIMKVYHIAMQY